MPLVTGSAGSAPAAQGATAGAKPTKEEKKGKAKARREAKYNAALLVKKVIEDAKLQLTADVTAALELLTRAPRVGGGGFGEPLFNKIYGATPAVGQSVTLQDIFLKTQKGADKMASLIRKWEAKKVAVVEHVFNAQEPVKSTYTIKSIG